MRSPVRDNAAAQRYEMDVDGDIAFIDYRRSERRVAMLHAEVPARLSGQGHGAALVKGALDLVRDAGETVVPLCSFVAAFIARHAEYQDLQVGR